jgi:hypothetical protein
VQLVGEQGETVPDGPGGDKAHGLLVPGLAEESLARAEHEWIDHQSQLVYEIVLDQRAG